MRRSDPKKSSADRRSFLQAGAIGIGSLTAATALAGSVANRQAGGLTAPPVHGDHSKLAMPLVVGEIDHVANGFHPDEILTGFDYGRITKFPDGRTLREYDFVAQNSELELVPGIRYPAWTYNGRMPGPTIRCGEGDRIRINFTNAGNHPHSIHFHGIHAGNMDGVFEPVPPGGSFVYEFDAEPFGVHLYHCHVAPLAKHISKGLYGAFIIDPPQGRPSVDRELVMIMAGLDIDFDGENDFYMVNSVPFYYDRNPIIIGLNELIKISVVNLLEFDLSNSFHLHGNFFHYYPTGTSLIPSEYTDTVAFMQGQRGIMEFRYKHTGRFMFHAHKTEFAELGWTAVFDVRDAKVS